MELVFAHGWGSDGSFWNELRALLPEYRHRVIENGYFSDTEIAVTPQDSGILIGHSLGFARALRLCDDWDGLVAINGFPRFVGAAQRAGCVAAAALREMKMRLRKDAIKTLCEFHGMIGSSPPSHKPDLQRLSDGLDELRDCNITEKLRNANIPLLVLAGANDPLVPETINAEFGKIAARSEIRVHPYGGHVLPLTHAAWCAAEISRFIHDARTFK